MDYIIDTIKKQIYWEFLRLIGFDFTRLSDIAALVRKETKTLRIHYNEASDYYDLTLCEKLPNRKGKTAKIKDVYFGQLVFIIAKFFDIEDSKYLQSYGVQENLDGKTCVICGDPIRKGRETMVGGNDINGPVHKECFISMLSEMLCDISDKPA